MADEILFNMCSGKDVLNDKEFLNLLREEMPYDKDLTYLANRILENCPMIGGFSTDLQNYVKSLAFGSTVEWFRVWTTVLPKLATHQTLEDILDELVRLIKNNLFVMTCFSELYKRNIKGYVGTVFSLMALSKVSPTLIIKFKKESGYNAGGEIRLQVQLENFDQWLKNPYRDARVETSVKIIITDQVFGTTLFDDTIKVIGVKKLLEELLD